MSYRDEGSMQELIESILRRLEQIEQSVRELGERVTKLENP